MGVTTRGLPYPEPEDFVYQAPNDFQELAEAIDGDLQDLDTGAPLLALTGTAGDPDSDGRLVWDTGSPVRTRGAWTYPSGGRLVIPPTPGLYLVVVDYTFVNLTSVGGGGGGPDPISVQLQLQHKVQGDPQVNASTFGSIETLLDDQNDEPQLMVLGMGYIDATANRGIQVRVNSPSLMPPGGAGDASARLQIFRLSRI